MANHLTPEELSKELGIDRNEVIFFLMMRRLPRSTLFPYKTLFLSGAVLKLGVCFAMLGIFVVSFIVH